MTTETPSSPPSPAQPRCSGFSGATCFPRVPSLLPVLHVASAPLHRFLGHLYSIGALLSGWNTLPVRRWHSPSGACRCPAPASRQRCAGSAVGLDAATDGASPSTAESGHLDALLDPRHPVPLPHMQSSKHRVPWGFLRSPGASFRPLSCPPQNLGSSHHAPHRCIGANHRRRLHWLEGLGVAGGGFLRLEGIGGARGAAVSTGLEDAGGAGVVARFLSLAGVGGISVVVFLGLKVLVVLAAPLS